jgi:DNA helicase-2/ATP-dependent DNA helicase PcrA
VWTANEAGDKIRLVRNVSESEEAKYVAQSIYQDKKEMQLPNKAFAILYRTNSQSRAFEEALRKQGLEYIIYGGTSFYQRKEIKDLLAYLRITINPTDEEALKRIINYPARQIGDTSVNRLIYHASEQGVSLWDIVTNARHFPDLGAAAARIENFAVMIKSFQSMIHTHNAYDLAMHIAKQTSLLRFMYEDKTVEGVSRYENLIELMNGIREFVENDQSDVDKSLAHFLEEVALYTDDQKAKDPNADCVALMTIHSSKGLEFPIVFVVGLEENLFPSQLSLTSRADLEEERRLFYVAITRAEKKLHLSFATSRFKYGTLTPCEPSRFVEEIDPEYLDMELSGLKQQGLLQRFMSGRSETGNLSVTRTGTLLRQTVRTPSPPPVNPNFVEGDLKGLKVQDKVEHQRFGMGVVKRLEGHGDGLKAIVDFNGLGEKTLVIKFAKMRIL